MASDDDGDLDLSDLTVEKLWNVAKRHTKDPRQLIEITVLATIAGIGPDVLAERMAEAEALGSGVSPLSGGAPPVPVSHNVTWSP